MKVILNKEAKERLINSSAEHIIEKAIVAAKEGRKTFSILNFSDNDYYAEIIKKVEEISEGTVAKYDNLINNKFKIV